MNSVSAEIPIVRNVEIENFKSIKRLEIECGRVNVFIGEPNSGKSNIIEAIVGLPSMGRYLRFGDVTDFVRGVRGDDASNLFYDNDLEDPINIKFKGFRIQTLDFVQRLLDFTMTISFGDGRYHWRVDYQNRSEGNTFPASLSFLALGNFKFYRFKPLARFDRKESEFLLPPSGRNLSAVCLSHKNVRSVFLEILNRYSLKLMIDSTSYELWVVKLTEEILIRYPYSSLSDTFQRLLFYLSAILTNKNSVIAMEEPEAHAFPYYTKYLAELIANDENNQYFITTHNPYFLLTLIEKTPQKDLAVYVTYYKNYQTKVKKLSEKKLQEVLDLGSSTFFNLDVLMED